jgi:5'-nucleotidase (lipoprotein e(P4) family)
VIPRYVIAASVVLSLAGCATVQMRIDEIAPGCGTDRPFADGAERATLWIRTSAEFRSSAEGTYRSALQGLERGLTDAEWSAEPSQSGDFARLPPAVVMDIDETVLDNSAPQARMLLAGACPGDFAVLWDAWIAERAAPAVPGAAAFIRAARELKDPQGRQVRVFLITNRECGARPDAAAACPQQDDTLGNLRALGLDAATLDDDLMLKSERPEWVTEKLPRRQLVAQSYRIVLNVGDDLGDFIADARQQSLAERDRARCRHRDWWGARWFMIPNPMYGSWQRALGADLDVALAQPPSPAACGDAG